MIWQPRPYQRLIRDFALDTPRANIWAGMGMGKTAAVLSALEILWTAGWDHFPALVVAPKRVVASTWPEELAKWDHLASLSYRRLGPGAEPYESVLTAPEPLHLVNFERLPALCDALRQLQGPWRTVVVDESRRLRGLREPGVQSARRAWALWQIAGRAHRWINMTGTPAPEGLIDLWGPQYCLDAGAALGPRFGAYRKRYFRKPTRWAQPRLRQADDLPEILRRVQSTTITIRAEDWVEDLYEPVRRRVAVALPSAAQDVYRDSQRRLAQELSCGATLTASHAGATFAQCWQIANGAVYTGRTDAPPPRPWSPVHDAKIQALRDILDELADEPVLIVYHFRHDRERLCRVIPGLVVLHTDEHIRQWNRGKIARLALHPGRAGHGLNLQDGGRTLLFFSQIVSLEHRMQVVERIGPMRQLQAGHPRPVLIWDLIAEGTVDEAIEEKIERKSSLQSAVLRHLQLPEAMP